MFATVDAVPWHEVAHAYGVAEDAPKWIRALNSEDYDLRSDAVYHFLWSCAFHQYTLYPATPFVLPFVIEALESPELGERECIGGTMKGELLNFVRACAEGGQRKILGTPHPQAPAIEDAVSRGMVAFERYEADADAKVAADAAWLVRWCRKWQRRAAQRWP